MKSLSIVAVATVLAWGPAALAQGNIQSSEEKAQAAEAFKNGRALFEKGEYLEAAAAFERAHYIAPHPSVLANIGYCYDEAGDYPRAVEVFRKYLKQPNPDNPKSNREIARHLKKLESRVGDLRVNCFTERCEVTVDNVSRGMAPITLLLVAGAHTVDVTTVDGRPVGHYEVAVAGGEKVVLDVNVTDSSSRSKQVAPPHPVETKPSPRLRAPFWIATATTVVGIGSVAVLGGLTHKARDDFKKDGSEDIETKELGEDLRLGTNIAIGVTAAAAATAIVLAIVDLKRDPKKDGKSRKTARTTRKFSINFQAGAFVGMAVGFH